MKEQPPVATKHLSPSQLKVFRDCERQFYFKYILGVRPPASVSQTVGADLHYTIERYLRLGEPISPEWAEYESEFARLLPPPMRHMREYVVEAAISPYEPPRSEIHRPLNIEVVADAKHRDVPVVGYVDLWIPPGNPHAGIWDHKSGSSRYFLKEHNLIIDPQMIIYGKFWFDQYPEARQITLTHFQVDTSRKHIPRLTQAVLDRASLMYEYDAIARDFDKMIELRENPPRSYWNVDDNFGASCMKYGGCYFKDSYCSAKHLIPGGNKP